MAQSKKQIAKDVVNWVNSNVGMYNRICEVCNDFYEENKDEDIKIDDVIRTLRAEGYKNEDGEIWDVDSRCYEYLVRIINVNNPEWTVVV